MKTTNFIRTKIPLLIIILMLCLAFGCQQKVEEELSDEQKAIIETEVKAQLEDLRYAIAQLNFDLWSESFSKDNFISLVHTKRGITNGWDEFSENVRVSFQNRERHKSTKIEENVTVLSSDMALSTSNRIWENWYNNGDYIKSDGKTTYLWKKEQDGWKIIHASSGGLRLEETAGN